MVGIGMRPRGEIAEADVMKIRMLIHVKGAASSLHFLSWVQNLCIIYSSTTLLFESEKHGTKRFSITSAVRPWDFVALRGFSTTLTDKIQALLSVILATEILQHK